MRTGMADIVLCIAGSPRRNGNTDRLLAEAMRGAREAGHAVEHMVVQRLKLSGCLECGGCTRQGRCAVADDMQEVFASLDRADHIIIATPVFFMGVPSKLKAVVDRCQVYWSRKFVRKEAVGREHPGGNGALIAVGASSFKHLFDGSRNVVKSVLNVLEFKYRDELLVAGLDGPGDVLERPEALERAYQMGRDIALRCDAAG